MYNFLYSKSAVVCDLTALRVLLPEVIQIIPAVETESQSVFLKTQCGEKLPYCLWCTLEDRHLLQDSTDKTVTENQRICC